jgi:hypothetical protein
MLGIAGATTLENARKDFEIEFSLNGWFIERKSTGIVARKQKNCIYAEVFYDSAKGIVGYKVIDRGIAREICEGINVSSEYEMMLWMERLAAGKIERYFL